MTKVGDSILAGLQDAIAYAQGDKSRCRTSHFISNNLDVKAIREGLNMTQEEFAETYFISHYSLKKWEENIAEPNNHERAYLAIIFQQPDIVKAALHEEYDKNLQLKE